MRSIQKLKSRMASLVSEALDFGKISLKKVGGKRKKSSLALLLIVLSCLVSFQNCSSSLSKGFEANSQQEASVAPQPIGASGEMIYTWVGTNWNSCSVQCGGGTQTRNVSCQNSNSEVVAESSCSQPKPATSQSCQTQACTSYFWVKSGFSPCSKSCGGGTQTQTVTCLSDKGQNVAESFCTQSKPATSQSCNGQSCPSASGSEEQGSISSQPSADRLAVYYGSVSSFGSLGGAVGQLGYADVAVFPVNYISPLPKLQNANGCHFPAEDVQGPALIKALKNFKPSMKIFINVPGAADAPATWGCGQTPPKALNDYWGIIRENVLPGNVLEADWSCPDGICTHFIVLANAVKAMGADGISIEYAGPLYMNRFVRDSEISYAKSLGLKVMLNVAVTRPDFFEWAAQSNHLGSGDYLSLEGYYSMGAFESAANAQAVNKIYQNKFSSKGLLIASLATTDVNFKGQDGFTYGFSWELVSLYPGIYLDKKVDCTNPLGQKAYNEFKTIWTPGSVFQLTTLEFGFITQTFQNCWF